MARKKIIAGNWKMNMTPSQAVALVAELKDLVVNDAVDVVYCVPAIDIVPVANAVKNAKVDDKHIVEVATKAMSEFNAEMRKAPTSSWAKDAWEKSQQVKSVQDGKTPIFDGSAPGGYITREQVAIILDRLGLLDGKYKLSDEQVREVLTRLGLFNEKAE